MPRHPPYTLSSFTKGSWSREWSSLIKDKRWFSLFYFSVTKWSYRLPQIAEDDSHLWIDINSQFSKNKKFNVELTGIEPATSWMQIRRSPNWAKAPKTRSWLWIKWAWVDSNHGPHPYQGCALTTWATSPKNIWYEWSQGFEFDHIPIKDRDFSLERRWSSRTFRYGYLVTT